MNGRRSYDRMIRMKGELEFLGVVVLE